MNVSTVPATFFNSSAYASICWMEASTIALNVPWMSDATNDGKSMALSVARATSPTRPVADESPDAGAAAVLPPAGAGAGAVVPGGAGEAGDPGTAGAGVAPRGAGAEPVGDRRERLRELVARLGRDAVARVRAPQRVVESRVDVMTEAL